tara:strand:- start:88 stop:756 length:669 start_codon:yes stop_codon:yes gene_type:complete
MSTKPKITVIIPTYNQEKYIGRCLRSLLDQSLERNNYEIIVVDDASKDKTLYALNLFKEDIKIILNKKNMGLPYSINKGITSAKGRYIVRVDSDDYVNKEFLRILYIFLSENPNMDAVSCDYFVVDNKEKIVTREDSSKKPIGCGIMFRIDQLITLGMYDKSFYVHEDKDLRYRFLKKYKITRIPLPLYRYRKHETNITNNKKKMKEHFKRFKTKHKIKKRK